MASYNLLINGVFLGVKKPTDPITFDPSTSGTRDIPSIPHLFDLFSGRWPPADRGIFNEKKPQKDVEVQSYSHTKKMKGQHQQPRVL